MEKVRVEVEIEDRKDVRVIEVEGKSWPASMARGSTSSSATPTM